MAEWRLVVDAKNCVSILGLDTGRCYEHDICT